MNDERVPPGWAAGLKAVAAVGMCQSTGSVLVDPLQQQKLKVVALMEENPPEKGNTKAKGRERSARHGPRLRTRGKRGWKGGREMKLRVER